jgi:hypothetical protein
MYLRTTTTHVPSFEKKTMHPSCCLTCYCASSPVRLPVHTPHPQTQLQPHSSWHCPWIRRPQQPRACCIRPSAVLQNRYMVLDDPPGPCRPPTHPCNSHCLCNPSDPSCCLPVCLALPLLLVLPLCPPPPNTATTTFKQEQPLDSTASTTPSLLHQTQCCPSKPLYGSG